MDKKRSKNLNGMICIVGALGGMCLGYVVARFVVVTVKLAQPFIAIAYVGSILLGLILGAVLAPLIVKLLLFLSKKVEERLQNYSRSDILGSVGGILIGLIVAFLLSGALGSIKSDLLVFVLEFLLYGVLVFIGARLGRVYLKDIFHNKKKDEGHAVSCKVLDTSALIDGRVLDIFRAGFIEGKFVVPAFILSELRVISDSSDPLKRNRGRRGLEILKKLQSEPNLILEISDEDFKDIKDIDSKLLALAQSLNGAVITNDYNLNKVAEVLKLRVLNVNELCNAVKPIMLPGEERKVKIIKEGKEVGQGVAFQEDGTMIVVENGGKEVGNLVDVVITTSIQTNTGMIIFARMRESM